MSDAAITGHLLRACVACGGRTLRTVETISAVQIADGWRRENIATGQLAIADRRARILLSALPPQIHFDACADCGLEIAIPNVVWLSDDYPADQSYPVRWEFTQSLDDLGAAPLDILELGCGPGEFLAMATARGHRPVGLDFSTTAVARARQRGFVAFLGGLDDLEQFLPADARFDAILLFQVIEHLPNPDALFAMVERWARPDARLFVACPGPRRYTRLIVEHQCGRSDFWDYPPHHVLRWTLPALRAVAGRHGWRPLAVMEEPLHWVGAASHIGVARAIHRGVLDRPVGRRLAIAAAWVSLLCAPSTRRAGTSIYMCAARGTGGTATL